MKYKIALLTVFAVLMTGTAWAVDITGKWIMTAPRPNGAIHQTFTLNAGEMITSGPATGNQRLTGTIETPFGPFDIFGEIADDEIFFCSYQHYKPDGMSLHLWYGQIVNENEIKFQQSFGSTGQSMGPPAEGRGEEGPQAEGRGEGGQPQGTGSVPNMDPEWEGRGNEYVGKYTAYRTTVENASLPRSRPGGGAPSDAAGGAPSGGQAPPAQR